MLGMSFDQLHRCDMSPLATGLGKNKPLQSNAAELPSLGTSGQDCPATATPKMLPGSCLPQVRNAQKLSSVCAEPPPP